MDTRHQYYLDQATHCLEMAEGAQRDDLAAEWLTLADKWLTMLLQPGSNVIHGRFADRADGPPCQA